MWKYIILPLGVLGLLGKALAGPVNVEFDEGQVWSFAARPKDPCPRLKIVTIDRPEDGMVIYHISLSGLSLMNPYSITGVQKSVAHLAVGESTLRSSVDDLLDEEFEVPADFSGDYENFYNALSKGKAEVWKIPIAEMLVLFDETLIKPVYFKGENQQWR